jgi:hypothetical protein
LGGGRGFKFFERKVGRVALLWGIIVLKVWNLDGGLSGRACDKEMM